MQDDDAATITSDDSFFSAAEVRTHTLDPRRAALVFTCGVIVLVNLSLSLSLSLSLQLFDAFSLDEVYQPLRPAALYEEAVSLVTEGKVSCRSFR